MKEVPEKFDLGVDTERLINNILTDYPGRFDMFRELIQNSDDAKATEIEIRFETKSTDGHHDGSQGHTVYKWVIRDNGNGVPDEKWKDLRTIARGNPDPSKVGTFGVGFYTVFGVCDEPVLRSKGQYVKLSRRDQSEFGTIPDSTPPDDGRTSVELVLKEDWREPLPDLLGLAKFLISSITFLETVNAINVFLAGVLVLHVCKALESVDQVNVPKTKSNSGMMTIKSIEVAKQVVSVLVNGKEFFPEPKAHSSEKATGDGDFEFSRVPNKMTLSQPSETKTGGTSEVACYLYTAQINAPKDRVRKVASVMKDTSCDLWCKAIYLNTEQQKAVQGTFMHHLFDGPDGILPRNNSGRVFIGQSTMISTGIGLHIENKRFVPDMSRSSVRLTDSEIGAWNKSLLRTAGCLAKAIYEREMKIAESKAPKLEEVEAWGLYTMQRFAFDHRSSETSPTFYLKSGFFSASTQSVLANSGIFDVKCIRQHDDKLHPILENIPYLHIKLSLEQREMIEDAWKIQSIQPKDMLNEFTSGHLSEESMERFFGWWEDATKQGLLRTRKGWKENFFKMLRDNGRLEGKVCGSIELKGIKRYTQLARRKEFLPPETIYLPQARNHADYHDLFGWEPLDPIDWLTFVCKLDVNPESRLEWDGLLDRLEALTDYTNDHFLLCLADMAAKKQLSDEQIIDLRKRKVLDSEDHGKHPPTALHRPDALDGKLREFNLPVLALQGASGYGDLLNKLGVRVYPPLAEIDNWLATSDETKVDLAIQCLKENGTKYNAEAKEPETAFSPAEGGILAHQNEVSSCPGGEELLFHTMLHALKKEPSVENTWKWLNHLASCVKVLKGGMLEELSEVPFISFPEPHLLANTPQCLKDCFHMSSLQQKPHLENILPFVELDVGSLVKKEIPKASDAARRLVDFPERLRQMAEVDWTCYENVLREIAKEFDSFPADLRDHMRESSILLGQCTGSYNELRNGRDILIRGDEENWTVFRQYVFVAPDGLNTLYEKLGSKPLDEYVTYTVEPTGCVTTFPPITREVILDCVSIFKGHELAREQQHDISSKLSVKTCEKLDMKKGLNSPCGFAPKDISAGVVAAGFQNDSSDSTTLWVVTKDHKNMYPDVAIALCRKLLKTYSREDVLAMEFLIRNEERRMAELGRIKTTGTNDIGPMPLEGPQNVQLSNSPLSVAVPSHVRLSHTTHPLLGRVRGFFSRGRKGPVVLNLDAIKSARQAESQLRMPGPSEEPRQSYTLLPSSFKRKDIRCREVVLGKHEDQYFSKYSEKYHVKFFSEKKLRSAKPPEEVVEAFAKLVTKLAEIFKINCQSRLRIFCTNTDHTAVAFNRQGEYIYLNLAHFWKHHQGRVDEKSIMDWYLIFAHEMAHRDWPQHDENHEKTFAGLCILHLDALRGCYPNVPLLNSTPHRTLCYRELKERV